MATARRRAKVWQVVWNLSDGKRASRQYAKWTRREALEFGEER